MRFHFTSALLLTAGSLASFSTQAQQVAPPAPQHTTTRPVLSNDSVRVMSGLVETSVRRLRAIYFEPNDTKATQLIDAALVDIPVLNQRLSHYTASLPREQQQLLAQRLRQQPWQVELNTLLRSPQYAGFDARAAKNPALQEAAERLHASGFMGTAKPVAAKAPAAAPMGTISIPTAPAVTKSKAQPAANSLMPAAKPGAAPVTKSATPADKVGFPGQHHTVQKGETLFSIAKQYKTTPAQLQQWNDKAEPSVKIGEVLVVEAGR
ncbi:LysM peptidoglycan-binding domain-containing protein [Hymenobacter endophyticus]|uniref:LysM peptidoglycan-binding domain-containing protein n=1 Tax=Hymenobacter endophyticus TaxID=3076335 RepID=A0ABU3TKJ8_9BACT|nr:LysM peptidoglycan-binding domain-containing protein [Hymenobacter endophyticus]MDU0371891.1 LysM peptidoglycan-binding domain-containing protein [Hymenobacter endophyticus]